MAARYLAIIDFATTDTARELAQRAASQVGLTTSFTVGNVTILVDPTTPCWRANDSIVIGTVFPVTRLAGQAAVPNPPFDADDHVAKWWGDYVVFAQHGANMVEIIRAPCGMLAAFRRRSGPLTLIASDIDILLTLGVASTAIDWDFVADHLTFAHLRGARTGLADIDELFAGDVTTIGVTHTTRRMLWSPWDASAASPSTDNLAALASGLRTTLVSTVKALAAPYRSILLELSGGLDSSIVAACLAPGDNYVAINLRLPDAEGDERDYARRVGARVGAVVEERSVDAVIDLARPATIRTARPGFPAILGGVDAELFAIATARGTDAFFGGTGGDSVFCSLGSSYPAADVWRRFGPGLRFVRTVRDIAEIHNTNVWTVGTMAIRAARRSARLAPWPRTSEFLAAAPPVPPFHPWLIEGHASPGGTRSHIRSIMAAMAHVDGYGRHAAAPSIYPLLAWPVVDACLRIPTWSWVSGGRDRAIARMAFADALPAEVVGRRTKGGIAAYCARTYQANRARLRPFLLDGQLAAAGVIDRAALAGYLGQTGPISDDRFYRVMGLADVEAWLRAWH